MNYHPEYWILTKIDRSPPLTSPITPLKFQIDQRQLLLELKSGMQKLAPDVQTDRQSVSTNPSSPILGLSGKNDNHQNMNVGCHSSPEEYIGLLVHKEVTISLGVRHW